MTREPIDKRDNDDDDKSSLALGIIAVSAILGTAVGFVLQHWVPDRMMNVGFGLMCFVGFMFVFSGMSDWD